MSDPMQELIQISESYDDSNILKDLFMIWIRPIIRYYKKNHPCFANILPLPKRLNFKKNADLLENYWIQETKNQKPNFKRALRKTIGKDIAKVFIADIISYDSLLLQALLMNQIIKFLEDPNYPINEGYLLIVLFLITTFLLSIVMNLTIFRLSTITTTVKGLISSLLYKKILKIHFSSISNQDCTSKILSIISSDLELLDSSYQIMYLCSFPIFIIGSFIIMGTFFKLSGVLGLLFTIIQVPLVYLLSKPVENYREKVASINDNRVKLIKMLIEGIRVVKVYGWEYPQLAKIFEQRKQQNTQIFRKNIYLSFVSGIGQSGFAIILLITFGSVVWYGGKLEAGEVFAGTTVLFLAFIQLNYILPDGLVQLFITIATFNRIQEALLIPESNKQIDFSDQSVLAYNACFSWTKNVEKINSPCSESQHINSTENSGIPLKINFTLGNELLIVTGKLGCGKTTFIYALLGELELIEGSLELPKKISYSSDTPWLIADSVRENIIMGESLDKQRYSKVLEICCLNNDIEKFKNNDLSIIGDQGVTLSGGQKARIALARALYKDSDIYLLDDPLSALDAKTGKIIIEGIKQNFSDKVVIMTGSQAFIFQHVDKILSLNHGNQIFFGTYSQYLIFYKLEKFESIKQNEENREKDVGDDIDEEKEDTDIEKADSGFSFKVFYEFLKMGVDSHWKILSILSLFLIVSGLNTGTLWWIAYWVDAEDQTDSIYINIFIVFIVSLFVFTVIRNLLFSYAYLKTTESIHNNSLYSLSYVPISFYDLNPPGKILNRFTRDIIVVDEILFSTFPILIDHTLEIVKIAISICIIVYYNIAVIVFICFVQYFIIKSLAKLTKQLRAIDLSSKSSVINIFNSTVNGVITIRAHDLQKKFIKDADKAIETNMKAFFTYNSVLAMFRTYTEFSSVLLNTISIIILVILRGNISGTLAALSLTFNVSMVGEVNMWAKFLIELNNIMSSPQRLLEYLKMSREGVLQRPTSFEILQGNIKFEQVCLRYRQDFPLALNNFSLIIPGGSKYGIMGRTGAGKSSILVALLRIVVPESGKILIDGKDYMDLGLHDLRTQISIIPQQPILFYTSIRKNIDPFTEHSDWVINEILSNIGLESIMYRFSKGLDSVYGEDAFFSAGEKQLISLARALIKDTKILVVDEATANVDKETEKIIQHSIKHKTSGRTVIIIAHRITTIRECDKIIIVKDGDCLECGTHLELSMNSQYYKEILEQTED
ncbi:hypothetical protein SteCoe_15916 [Stentor coeruleus]|uniref:Uncharacterized protein n=1 Tax=Stentor coeruleus TaxID=5963 RepID=A0A1R2C2J5_9CILI|nr:hypothetical protein SteCoe_15916 [Stentor coeruleus]